jgi:hypothetical protein
MTHVGEPANPRVLVPEPSHGLASKPVCDRYTAASRRKRHDFDEIETRKASEMAICSPSTRIHERRKLVRDGNQGPMQQTQSGSIRQAEQTDIESPATRMSGTRTRS